jgi:hypothetical protein
VTGEVLRIFMKGKGHYPSARLKEYETFAKGFRALRLAPGESQVLFVDGLEGPRAVLSFVVSMNTRITN